MSAPTTDTISRQVPMDAPAPGATKDAPSPLLVPEGRLKDLRAAYKSSDGPARTGPMALSLVSGALTKRDDRVLSAAIYEALMHGFSVQQLTDLVVPVLVTYVGIDAAPRFHGIMSEVLKCLLASNSVEPAAIRAALSTTFLRREVDLAGGQNVLTDAELQAIRRGFSEKDFKEKGRDAVRGPTSKLDILTALLDNTIFDAQQLDPKLREAMILAAVATKGDLPSLGVHCYAAIGEKLEPQEVLEILRSIQPPDSARLAVGVLETVLAVLKQAAQDQLTALPIVASAIRKAIRD